MLGGVICVIAAVRLIAELVPSDYERNYEVPVFVDGSSSADDGVYDDRELQQAIREIAMRQAAAASEAELVAVHGGYAHYEGSPLDDAVPDGYEAIAVDVAIRLPADAGFDFDDIDVLVNGENHGSDPLIQRLTPEGTPASWDDPVFDGSDVYRVLLVYWLPEGTTEVSLEYWGAPLTTTPIALHDTSAPAMLPM